MKELEKLYEQNGVPAPEFHPMLEPKAQPALPTSRSGKVSRRDSKFLAKLGIPPGTPVDTALPKSAPVASAPQQQPVIIQQPPVYQQPAPQPSSPITVQINLQPTPVGNMVPPQSIQYQMPANGQLAPVTVPVPMQIQQPLAQQQASAPGKGNSTTALGVNEKEYFPNERREVHDSESDEFFFNGEVDGDEKMELTPAAKPGKNTAPSTSEITGKFPTVDEAPKQEMQSSDPAFNTQPELEDKPVLEAGENPFGFPTAGIKEANKKLSNDTWVSDMKKSANTGIEAKTVSSSKAEPNLITSKDFEKNKLETPADRRLRLIRERQGQTGLKGFCPVVLRDQRELLDSNLEYRVQHEGKTYHVSSAESQAKFLADPARYAPANQGNDIVQQEKSGAREEGSLDHALWFGGKLYLFTSGENQSTFAQQPKKYLR
jgi:YHS domain-containing protein